MRPFVALLIIGTATACNGDSALTDGGSDAGPQRHVYVANSGSTDVSVFTIDDSSGALTPIAGSPLWATLSGPNTFALAPSLPFLYLGGFEAIAAFSVDARSGLLTPVGAHPVANSPAIALGFDPSARFLIALSNVIRTFTVDATTGALAPASQTPPLNFATNGMAVAGSFVYVSTQLAQAGDLEGFSVDSTTGALTRLPGSPFASFLAVAIAADPLGKYLYVCDQARGVRSYAIDGVTGALTELAKSPLQTGANPLSITTDHAGKFVFVANFNDDTVLVASIDATTGSLTPVPGSPFPVATTPHVSAVDSSDRFLYVTEPTGAVAVYAIDSSSGALTAVVGSPFAVGPNPIGVISLP